MDAPAGNSVYQTKPVSERQMSSHIFSQVWFLAHIFIHELCVCMLHLIRIKPVPQNNDEQGLGERCQKEGQGKGREDCCHYSVAL